MITTLIVAAFAGICFGIYLGVLLHRVVTVINKAAEEEMAEATETIQPSLDPEWYGPEPDPYGRMVDGHEDTRYYGG